MCFSHIPFSTHAVYHQALAFANNMAVQLADLNGCHLDPVNGRWFRPPLGYYKLNTDGSVRNGCSAFGGLLLNHAGEWVWGFTGRLAILSSLQFKRG